jgi:hypothetical protein
MRETTAVLTIDHRPFGCSPKPPPVVPDWFRLMDATSNVGLVSVAGFCSWAVTTQLTAMMVAQ